MISKVDHNGILLDDALNPSKPSISDLLGQDASEDDDMAMKTYKRTKQFWNAPMFLSVEPSRGLLRGKYLTRRIAHGPRSAKIFRMKSKPIDVLVYELDYKSLFFKMIHRKTRKVISTKAFIPEDLISNSESPFFVKELAQSSQFES